MKKLLMLMALVGLGFSVLGCAGESKPPAAPANAAPPGGPTGGEAKPDAPTEPAPAKTDEK